MNNVSPWNANAAKSQPKNGNLRLIVNWTKPESVNAYMWKQSPARLQLSLLILLSGEKAIAVKEPSLWIERLVSFSCISNVVLLSPPFCRVLLDDPSVQNFKCFLPTVTINFASDEKPTLEIVEHDEVAWSLVTSFPLRQSQR